MTKLTLFLSLLLTSLVLYSSPNTIVIKGRFPGAEGREIRVMEYADQISYRESEVTSAIVNAGSSFHISFTKHEPQYIFFRVDHARMGMFIEPGKEYELVFDKVDFEKLDDRVNPYLEPWYFNFTITSPADDINKPIHQLEDTLQEYMQAHLRSMQRSRNQAAFQPIREKTDALFGSVEAPYFRDYYRYLYAYYWHVSNLKQPREIALEYIYNQKVLYQNTQYMNVFNMVFDTYIFAGSRKITLTDLRHTINELNSYKALMDSLGKDTLLRNEVIRELVMIKGLQDMYGNPDYKRANVENILNHVSRSSKFPQHRTIAANILHEKKKFSAGTQAPAFSLSDDAGNSIQFPNDFKGKYLYLVFWTSWCESCKLDLVALNALYSRHKDNLNIITISTDRHIQAYQATSREMKFPWPNLYFNNNFRLLDAYAIKSIPTYVLIDRQGNIVSNPAKRPSDDLIVDLERLLLQERRSGGRR